MSNKISTFWELIQKHRIEIPIIQRDYAQGRSNPQSTEIRNNFVYQIREVLTTDVVNKNLHLNFIYGKINGGGNDAIDAQQSQTYFIPLDGQQRLTTLFLAHLYLMPNEGEVINIMKHFSYKVRPSSQMFCEKLIDNIHNTIELSKDEELISENIKDSSWFFKYWRKDPTVRGMLKMLDEIHLQFKDIENKSVLWGRLNRIQFDFLDLDEYKLTDELYVKMNARGVPLTPFENFKAWLIEYIQENKIEIKKFKKKKKEEIIHVKWVELIDTVWTDLFWENKDNDNMLIDEELMRYFRNMMQIFLVLQGDFKPETDSKDEEKKKEAQLSRTKAALLATTKDDKTGEYKYVPNSFFVDNKLLSQENIDELFCSINNIASYDKLINEALKNIEVPILFFDDRGSIFKKFIDNKTTYLDKVVFYALHTFLKNIPENITESNLILELRSWIRVIRNLVENSTIDNVPLFKRAIKTIKSLKNECFDINSYLSKQNEKFTLTGFDGYQAMEEVEKAKLICQNNELEEVFLKYENHNYFKGQIFFLIKITNQTIKESSVEINKDFKTVFEEYAIKMSNIFDNKSDNDVLFERALLTTDDYLISSYSNWSFCLMHNKGKYIKRWKDHFFKNNGKLLILKKLLDSIQVNSEKEGMEILCKTYITNPQKEKWRCMFVKTPSAITYCEQRLIRWKNKDNILLLGSSATSHYHAELYSYCLFKNKIENLLINDCKPFKGKRYYSVKSASEKACIVIDDWKYLKHNYALDIYYQDGKFFFSFFDRNEHKCSNELITILENEEFIENKLKWVKEAKNKDFEEIKTELMNFCSQLYKLK